MPWVAGWAVERAGADGSDADGSDAGPRWIADGGPDGEPCIEVTGREGSYVLAHATPVPVEPGRRYVVSVWGFAQGHYARYCRRGPAVRWLAAGGRCLVEATPPSRVLPGNRDDFETGWTLIAANAVAPPQAAWAVPVLLIGRSANDAVIRLARPAFSPTGDGVPRHVQVLPEQTAQLAGDDTPLLVRVRVTDAAGHIVADGTPVRVTSPHGTVEPSEPTTVRGEAVCHFMQRGPAADAPAAAHPGGAALLEACCAAASAAGTITLLPSVTIIGDLRDAATEAPIAARVVLRGVDGAPVRGGFWADGRFVAVVPPGPWQLTVSHGFDYEPADFRGAGAAGARVACALHRWRDLRASGWVSFEPHKHIAHGEQIIPDASFERAALGAQADGVDAFFGAQHWGDLGGRTKSQLCAVLSGPLLLVDWNTEIKRFPTGHSWEIGGGEYQAGLEAHGVPGQPVRANWEHHLAVRRRGGAVAFTHPNVGHNPATELPFCLFAGPTFDALDLFTGSNYDVLAERNERIWYWMLNQGYEIAATASTDGGLDREWASPIGGGRTYAFLGAERLSVAALARAVRDGRTVASTGPMIFATAAGQGPGACLAADGTSYQVHVEAWGGPGREGGLRRVELVCNGGVHAKWAPTGEPKHFVADCHFVADGAAWIVARAVTTDGATAVASPLYFRPRGWQPPTPPPAKVTLDLEQPLRAAGGAVTVEAIAGDRVLWRRRVDAPQLRCDVPAITWFRTTVADHLPIVTSVFYDCAPLRAACTHLGQTLEQKARALATPELFERVRVLLEDVRLTVPATAAEITPPT